MNTTLSQEQVSFYQANGFIVIDDFLTPRELEQWREAIDEAVRGRGKRRMPDKEWQVDEESYYNNVFVQRVNLWRDNAAVREIMVDGRLGKMAATLAGVDGV